MTKLSVLSMAALAFSLLAGGGAAAQTIKDFQGHYVGLGVTRVTQPTGRVAARDRDLDVVIRATPGGGFSLTWRTIYLFRWTKTDESRRRVATLIFKPTVKPGLWRAARSGDPLAGKAMIWARLAGSVLTVYVVAVADDGRLVTAIYRRRLFKDGIQLDFVSARDGKRVRAVSAALRRAKKK
jgi:hypothetical protein